jgi:diketogulonate reductase-like aldo/keto reductase
MGERTPRRGVEAAALQLGVELGATLIDTAEMYGEGGAEEVIAQALSAERDRLFIVSKVYPHNATRRGTIEACERSLRRLNTDRIDLYLLHWRGAVPLAETLEAFEQLRHSKKIRYWGVSNFDTADMHELAGLPGGSNCAANQVLYNLARRGVEWGLLPWQRERGIPTMAYSPIDQARLLKHKALASIAGKHGATPAQIALAWLLRQTDVITIPKASDLEHVRENFAALRVALDAQDLADLDRAFPAPAADSPLQVL